MNLVTNIDWTAFPWLGYPPTNWRLRPLKHELRFNVGWTPPTGNAESFEGENLWATIGDMDSKTITDTQSRISEDAVKSNGIKICPVGSLLYSFKLSVGKVAFVGAELYTNEAIASFHPSQKADLHFFYYALPDYLWRYSEENIYGAKLLNQERIKNARLAIPPTDEQRRIAEYLDEQTTKIDRLMEMRRRQMDLLKEQRAALIQLAVTRGLNPNVPMKDSGLPWIGQMPRDWQLLPLRAVLSERGEFNTNLRTTDFLSVIKDVGVVPYDERVATGNRKSEEMEKYKIIHPGDIVANRMNLIFGSVGLSAHFGCSSTEYYVLRGRNSSVDTRFYGLIFQSKGFQRSLVGIGSGILAHRMRIYYEALKAVLLPVPSIQQQQEIVEYVEKENAQFDQLHAAYARQLEVLTEYRASLIHECVTGQRSIPGEINA